MLNYGQLKFSFIYYKICHKFCLLPFELYHLTFRRTSGLRYYVWKLQYLLSSAYGIFIAIRLLQLLFVDSDEINLIYFSAHAAMALTGILQCMYHKMLITQMENNLILCNELLLQVNQPSDEEYGLSGLVKDLRRLWKFSVPEILLILFPFVMMGTSVVIVPVLYILQHDAPQFLYSLCPEEYRSIQAVILFAVPESWLVWTWIASCFHFGFVTAGQLQTALDVCEEEKARLRLGVAVQPAKVVRRYRESLLQIHLYNSFCSGVIYMTKLLFMTMTILGFFILIRFGPELHISVIGINLSNGVCGIFFYSFLYDAAVWMPIKFNDLKHSLYSGLTQAAGQDRANIRRELVSLPAVKMKVGSFDSFKQTSIPEFIDYVVQQICSLLLTFK